MQEVGRLAEIWRFPVKSLVGERIEQGNLVASGLFGDRLWAVRDLKAGGIRSAKQMPKLLLAGARFREEPAQGVIPEVDITLPGGSVTSSDAPDGHQRVSDLVGRRIHLERLRPAEDTKHFRSGAPRSKAETRALFGLARGEALPDLSNIPFKTLLELKRFATPRGTYVDVAPLHLLTTASLRELSERAAALPVDARRFRPTMLIKTAPELEGMVEWEWADGTLHIGDAVIRVGTPTVRCSMPARAQADGVAAEKTVLKALTAHTGRHLGCYASVSRPGSIRVGDLVRFAPSEAGVLSRSALQVARDLKRLALTAVSRTLYR